MKRSLPALLVLTAFMPAMSAMGADDPITRCRIAHSVDATSHIRCLEDALRASGPIPALRETVAPQASAPPAVAATEAAATAAPVISSGTVGSAAVADSAQSATPAAATSAPTPAGLGAEQAEQRKRAAAPESEQENARVRIVEFRYTRSGLGVFRMADGQVWQETVASPDRIHLKPDREYDATIERGKIGGYRMYVDGVRWMHRVERLL